MFLITGATGNVGREVVNQLLGFGRKVRVFTRDAAKVSEWGDRVEVAEGEFGSEEFGRAVVGVDSVFLMNVATNMETFGRMIAAMRAASVPRVVFLSSLLANSPDLAIGKLHLEKEEALRASGLPVKFVRPGGFMSNTYQWIGSIKTQGVVYNALGTGRYPMIAPEDIASVAVRALTDPTLVGEVFELTGGQMFNTAEQVEILSRVLGKPLQCVDVPVERAVERFISVGVPAHMAAAVGQSFQAIRDGRGVDMTDTVVKVTGRQPKKFEVWAQEHAARFN